MWILKAMKGSKCESLIREMRGKELQPLLLYRPHGSCSFWCPLPRFVQIYARWWELDISLLTGCGLHSVHHAVGSCTVWLRCGADDRRVFIITANSDVATTY